MAKVPFSGVPEVGESTQSLGRENINVSPESFGAGLGEGLQTVAAEGLSRSEMIQKHAIAFQQQDNQIANDTGYTKLLDGLNTISLNYRSLQGSDAINGYQKAHDDMMNLRDQISATMPNQAARIMFDNDSRRLTAMQADSLATHAAQQRLDFIKQQKLALVTSATTSAIVNYKDPAIVASSIADGWHAWDQANPGASAEVQAAGHQTITSNIYSGIVQRMLANGDVVGANDFFQKHIADFTPDKIGAIDNVLKPGVRAIQLQNGIQTIMHGYLGAPPKPEDFHAAIQNHGEMTPDGRMSVKGAAGPMQVLPSTAQAMALQLGVPWDPQKWAHGEKKPDGSIDWSYNQKLGNAYADEQMRTFSNPTLAALAYESGPGNVKQALESIGDPRNGSISMDDFLNKYGEKFPVGAAYARRVTAALGGTKPGTPPTDADIGSHLDAWLGEARDWANYARPGDPTFAKDLEAGITTEVNRQRHAIDLVRASANQNLSDLLLGGAASLTAMFAQNPDSRTWYAALKPTEQAHILRQLNENAVGHNILHTDKTEAMYRKLAGEATNDPNTFIKENLNEYALPQDDRKKLNNLQRKLLTGPVPNEDIGRALTTANRFGLSDAIPDKTSDEYHQFTGGLMQAIDRFENVHKRKPNDSDIKQMTQDLLLDDASKNSGIWPFDHEGRVYENEYTSRITEVPVAERAAIATAYKKRFGKDPSLGQMVYWYERAHAR